MRWFACVATMTLVVTGCGMGATTIETTATTTTTVAAETTTTLPAPLVAGPIGDWGGEEVHTVCLTSEQTFPQVPGYTFDFDGLATELLAPSGVTVVAAGQPCDANLQLSAWLEGRPAEYKELGTVYSGMLRKLDLTLSGVQGAPVEYHELTDLQPGDLASSLDPRTPEEFVTHYEDVWATILIEGFVRMWGPVVAIEVLRSPEYEIKAHAELCDIAGFGVGECTPSGYLEWRAWYEAGG